MFLCCIAECVRSPSLPFPRIPSWLEGSENAVTVLLIECLYLTCRRVPCCAAESSGQMIEHPIDGLLTGMLCSNKDQGSSDADSPTAMWVPRKWLRATLH